MPPAHPRQKKHSRKSRPDTVDKLLEAYPDVFADIINVLLYNGNPIVNPQFLTDGPSAAIYKAADGFLSQKNRDLAMYDTSGSPLCILYGLENQTKPSPIMPARVMGYDAASYDHNIRLIKSRNLAEGRPADYSMEIHSDQKLNPVITLTLYFGLTPWNGPRCLHDLLFLSEDIKKFLPDYPINLAEVAFLTPDTIEKFTSDFQIVAWWFRARRLKNTDELRTHQKEWIHVEELLEFFYVFAGDDRYRELKSGFAKRIRKGESITMCTLVDSLIEEGMEKGIKKGISQGIAQTRYRDLAALIRSGMPHEQAARLLEFSQEELEGFHQWTALQ